LHGAHNPKRRATSAARRSRHESGRQVLICEAGISMKREAGFVETIIF
jgi:hypothetical protein